MNITINYLDFFFFKWSLLKALQIYPNYCIIQLL